MDKKVLVTEWLKIDYSYMAKRLGFINIDIKPSHELILNTIRLIDSETTMEMVL